MPDGQEVEPDSFQTKSIWCGMDLFTITAAGRLIFQRRRFEVEAADDGERTSARVVSAENVDMEYHGDLLICGATPGGASVDYVVRFTHGAVEWIRPLGAMTEIHRLWLLERGQ